MNTKREWCYCNPPRSFDYPRCSCGNADTVWSEYKEYLWCPICRKDFIPEYQGILDGPIPIGTATLMGINFDRYEIPSMKIQRFNIETLEYANE